MTAVADGFVVMADVPVTAAHTTAAASAMTATTVPPLAIARVVLFVIGSRRRKGPAAAVAIVGRDRGSRVVDLCLGRCLCII